MEFDINRLSDGYNPVGIKKGDEVFVADSLAEIIERVENDGRRMTVMGRKYGLFVVGDDPDDSEEWSVWRYAHLAEKGENR